MYTDDKLPIILDQARFAYTTAYVGIDDTRIFICDDWGDEYSKGREVIANGTVDSDPMEKSTYHWNAKRGLWCCTIPESIDKEMTEDCKQPKVALKVLIPKGTKVRRSCNLISTSNFFRTGLLVDKFVPVKILAWNNEANIYKGRLENFIKNEWKIKKEDYDNFKKICLQGNERLKSL